MKKATTFWSNGDHRWTVIARDPARPDFLIDTNEYLVESDGIGMICDPGGSEIFPVVFSALSSVIDPLAVRSIFASHQDPDIVSSLSLWLEVNPELKCYVSRLWAGFIPHFGGVDTTFVRIPDAGLNIRLCSKELRAVPAHYLHSSGNFHLYDPEAKILFSGDVGAALLPADAEDLFVTDFDRHIRHAEGFHRRWMGSNSAKNDWCERAAALDIDLLCPQHGAIYEGDDVGRFLNWFRDLQVGIV